MIKHTVGILGGAGFVGKHLASRLVSQGHAVRIVSRHPERHRGLSVLPTLQMKQAMGFEHEHLLDALSGCNVVVNLIGILNERGHSGKEFRATHVDLTQNVVKACKSLGIRRYLHMSALGADQARGGSHYLRTKGQAEDWVHQQASEDLSITSFRPSIIFGTGDNFFNHFAKLLKIVPFFPVPCGGTQYSPVFVGDVVTVMANAIDDIRTHGQRFDLVGPKTYSLRDLIQYTADVTGSTCKVFSLNKQLSLIMAGLLEYFPGKPFSLDNYRSALLDSTSTETLPDYLNWQPRELEVIVPTYLGDKTRSAIYSQFRGRARR